MPHVVKCFVFFTMAADFAFCMRLLSDCCSVVFRTVSCGMCVFSHPVTERVLSVNLNLTQVLVYFLIINHFNFNH